MIVSKLRIDSDIKEPLFVEYIFNIQSDSNTISLHSLFSKNVNIFFYISRCYSFHFELDDLKTDEVLIEQVYGDIIFKLSNAFKIYGDEVDIGSIGNIFKAFTVEF